MDMKKRKQKAEKEYEIFKVKEKGKERIVKAYVKEDGNPEGGQVKETKNQVESENKLLRNILIGIGVIILVVIAFVFAVYLNRNFEYKGVNFVIDKEAMKGKTLYRTSIPVNYTDKTTNKVIEGNYNFYLRNDPRKLGEIPFDDELILSKTMVINESRNFNCNGDGIISVKNLVNLYEILGVNIIKDENASCDPLGRYMFVRLQESEKTSIEKTDSLCYNLNINNCEILKATERMMLEAFIRFNEINQ